MKKLKADVWEEVSNKCTNHIKSEDKENVVSFHDMVGELAQKSTAQKQASMSFYFICLLHLANEKNLVIKDCSNLNDLMVSRGVEQ
jgi:condensin complex subunit 2